MQSFNLRNLRICGQRAGGASLAIFLKEYVTSCTFISQMLFDPEHPIVKLCAEGMMQEGEGNPEGAARLFLQAWNESTDDFGKFIAAHYIARHQQSIADKLNWDEIALKHALNLRDEQVNAQLPSLYLNVAKGFEDLGQFENAKANYLLAQSFADAMPDDGYARMIRSGIMNGLGRINAHAS
ncbi:MAG TPA: rRNA adenine methyltransferase [Bacteroidia bacterium]|nr:rRNA adenine methyltransferase [Bacteroidia bacterium]